MAQTWESRRLRHERTMDRRFVSVQRELAQRIGAIVQRHAVSSGDGTQARTVPNTRNAKNSIRREVWRDVLKPYYIGTGDDPLPDESPRSPYAVLLRDGVYGALLIQAQREAALINRLVRDETVVQWLTGPRPVETVTEVRGAYDPWHEWVDPNGYRLSDRIWQTSARSRASIDRMLSYHIQQGTSVERLAELLEDYMTPGARLIRTRTPYGREGSYAARRLARTEITAAAGRGTINAAQANPFVGWIQWRLSPSHGCCDECDVNARGGENGDGIYPLDNYPPYPAHPHCVTPGQSVTTERGDIPIEQVRRWDRVLTHEGRYQTVLAAWHRPFHGLVYEFETDAGDFELTGNHPVLTRRGWADAKSVQLGDQVLYAGVNIAFDSVLAVSEYAPSANPQPFIAACIERLFSIVPSAVTFDADLDRWHGKVNEVPANPMLSETNNACSLQSIFHQYFDARRIVESLHTRTFQHWHQTGIIPFLGFGNLGSHFGTLGRIVFAGQVKRLIYALEHFASHLAATAVISLPGGRYCFASATHGDANFFQKTPKSAESDRQLVTNFWREYPLDNVQVSQDRTQSTSGLGFNAQTMPFEDSHVMSRGVFAVRGFEQLTANGASEIERHSDNLLSLSPDGRMGRESGNPLVSEVANPTQAHTHYSTIRAIRTREYSGPVYNMEVEEDHSYTVNGAAVHNCMCSLVPVPAGNTADLVESLRDDIRRQTSRARLLQGLFNPAFLAGALLTGRLNELLGKLDGIEGDESAMADMAFEGDER